MSSYGPTRRTGRLVAGAVVLVAAGALAGTPTAVAAQPATETTAGFCRNATLTAYGHRLRCLPGSSGDRVRVGPIDDTFAIRWDSAVVYTSANFGWSRAGNLYAVQVTWVDATRNGLQGVCVETSDGGLRYSSYDRLHGWQRSTVGCAAG